MASTIAFATSPKTAARDAHPSRLAKPTIATMSRAARATNARSGRVLVGWVSCSKSASIAAATRSSRSAESTTTLNCVTSPPVDPREADSCRKASGT